MSFIFDNSVIYSPTSSIELGKEKKPIKIINIDKNRRLEVPFYYPYTNNYYPKIITYIDVNSDKNLRKKMVMYFRRNILNKWIYDDTNIHKNFNVTNNKVKILKNKNKKKKI